MDKQADFLGFLHGSGASGNPHREEEARKPELAQFCVQAHPA